MKIPPPDVTTLLNAAYAFEIADPVDWLDGVGAAAVRGVPGAMRGHALLLRMRGAEQQPEFVAVSDREHTTPEVLAIAREPEFARAVMDLGIVGLAGPVLDRGLLGTLPAFVRNGALPRMPRDVLWMQAATGDAAGASLAVYLEERAELEPAVRALWVDVAAHFAAAARLRLAGLPSPAAVLDSSHKVLDATGPAQSKSAREALRTAARAVDDVRGRKVTDPEEALTIWRVLTEGRWTIAEDFDTHGRRTIVAYENTPMPKLALPLLTLRERQVVCFVALGHTNKQVAYELGLSVSSIATHLAKAMTKLAVRSRTGLVERLMKPPAVTADVA